MFGPNGQISEPNNNAGTRIKVCPKLRCKKKARNLRALCSKVYLVRILKVDLEAKIVSFILFQYINIA